MNACTLPVYTLPQLCARGSAQLGSHRQFQEKHWQVLRQTDGKKCVGFCLLITRTLKPGLTEVYLKRECQAGGSHNLPFRNCPGEQQPQKISELLCIIQGPPC